jgi:hypothetical protein
MWCWAIPVALTLDIKRSNPAGKRLFGVAIISTISIGLFESWTRMFLGVHTLDQVIFAALIGIWLAFTFEYLVRKWLMDHIMKLNQNRTDDLLSLSALAIIATVFFVMFFGMEWIGYYFFAGSKYWTPNQTYIDNIMDKCEIYNISNPNVNVTEVTEEVIASFAQFEIPEGGECALPFGAYIGTLI